MPVRSPAPWRRRTRSKATKRDDAAGRGPRRRRSARELDLRTSSPISSAITASYFVKDPESGERTSRASLPFHCERLVARAPANRRGRSIRRSSGQRKTAPDVIHKKLAFSTALACASMFSTSRRSDMLVIIRIFSAVLLSLGAFEPGAAAVPTWASRSTAFTAISWRARCCTSISTWPSSITGNRSGCRRTWAGQCSGNAFTGYTRTRPTGSSTSSRRRCAATRFGQFFAVWGQPLSRDNVAGAKPRPGEHTTVWVDGNLYSGDPRAIEL